MIGRLLRMALAAMLAIGGVVVFAPQAQAAGYDGYCTDDQGVTVVVDFQSLGGGIVIRCAPAPLPGSGTGLDAIKGAGVPYEGVRRWGDAFMCRLYGEPSATQNLAIPGNPNYREQCIDTPPTAAYWSYWTASNGGRWGYSSYGVKNHKAIAGGFEGWSFALGTTEATSPAPRAAPRRPAAAAPPASPTPPPAASASSPPAQSGQPPQPGGGAAPGGSKAAPKPSSTGSSPAATQPVPSGGSSSNPSLPPSLAATEPPPSTTATSDGTTSDGTTSDGTTSAGATTAGGSPTGDSGGQIVSSDQLLAQTPTTDGGSPLPTILGLGALAFLVTAGAGTAWRRRHR